MHTLYATRACGASEWGLGGHGDVLPSGRDLHAPESSATGVVLGMVLGSWSSLFPLGLRRA